MRELTREQIRTYWLEALRSGRFKQGKGHLRKKADDGTIRYCCLGVLTCVLGTESISVARRPNGFGRTLEGFEKEAVGLVTTGGRSSDSTTELWNENDNGVPFEEIADMIETGDFWAKEA